ncbi:MAG: hypothetical protein Q4D38_01095 [Planctomycetia bacterium]|nr:hypothetical protein [Planctomycetia bacterium]
MRNLRYKMRVKLFVIIFIMACFSLTTRGETPSAKSVGENDAEEKKVPWVFIPVDEEGRPVGEEYYLPLDMYGNLYKDKSTARKNDAFFFHSALYSGALSSALSTHDVVFESMKVVLDVEVRAAVEIELPFSNEEMHISPGGVLLNGTPLPIEWEGGRLHVEIKNPGRYSLEISFLPTRFLTPKDGGRSKSSGDMMVGFRFAIPFIPNSHLELQAPAAFSGLEFPSAKGKTTYVATERRWRVDLGGSDEICVRWKSPYAPAQAPNIPVAEEAYWWNLGGESMKVQCRYRFRATQEGIRSLEWSVDSRYQIDSESIQIFTFVNERGRGENSYSMQNNDGREELQKVFLNPGVNIFQEGENTRIRMEVNVAASASVYVVFSLDFPRIAQVGNYFFPHIRTEKTRIAKRWINVCSESQYQLSLVESNSIQSVSFADFCGLWNNMAPDAAQESMYEAALNSSFVVDDTLSASNRTTVWMVKSQPALEIFTALEVVSYLFDADIVNVHYNIQFPYARSIPFICRAKVPSGLQIENIVFSDGVQKGTLDFSRLADDTIVVFNNRPSLSSEKKIEGSSVQLTLIGSLNIPHQDGAEARKMNFPQISLLNDEVHVSSRVVNIYRTPRVVLDFSELTPQGDASGAYLTTENTVAPFEEGRIAASFSSKSAKEMGGVVSILTNQPKVFVHSRAILKCEESATAKYSQWNAELELVVKVSQGVLDEFPIEISGALKGALALEPPIPFEVEQIPIKIASLKESAENATGTHRVMGAAEDGAGEAIPSGGSSLRLLIRPLYPMSGVHKIKIIAPLSFSDEAGVLGGVVLPIFSFPNAEDVQRDIVLPLAPVQTHNHSLNWVVERMTPLDESVLQVETNSGAVGFDKLKSEPGRLQAYRAAGSRCRAMLQTQDSAVSNPAVLWASHGVLWGVNRKFPGVTIMDVSPQNAKYAVVRAPRTLEMLEFRLDAAPVLAERIIWDAETRQFDVEKSNKRNEDEYNYYRVALHSTRMVQRLEILYYGAMSQHAVSHAWGKVGSFSGRDRQERNFRLELPILITIALEEGEEQPEPLKAESGVFFAFTPSQSGEIRLWETNSSGESALYPERRPMRVHLACLDQILLLTRQAVRETGSSGVGGVVGGEISGNFLEEDGENPGVMPNSETFPTDEIEAWRETWKIMWDYKVAVARQELLRQRNSEFVEFSRAFDAILKEGDAFFQNAHGKIVDEAAEKTFSNGSDKKTHVVSWTQKKTLQEIFAQNLPRSAALMFAFETKGESEFYLSESAIHQSLSLPFIYSSMVVVLITIFILVVLYLSPQFVEKTRTGPIWLFISGIIGMLCGLKVWIGLLIMASAVLLGIMRMTRKSVPEKEDMNGSL